MVIELSLAAACLAFIVTQSSLFQPIRNYFKDKRFFGKLTSCYICFSLWSAALMAILYYPFDKDLFRLWLATAFLSIGWQTALSLCADISDKLSSPNLDSRDEIRWGGN